MIITLKGSKLILALIPLTFMVSGCNQEDLTAVEQFGLMSAVIRQSSSNIVQDIYSSCVRSKEKQYQELATSNIPADRFPPVGVRQLCQPFIPVRDTTNQLNIVLIDYVESLGRLASDNTVAFNQNLQTVGNSLGSFGKALSGVGVQVSLTPEQIQQGTNIVNSLLKLWSQQFRRDNLKQVLICTDDPYFQNYTSLLIEVIQEVYIGGNLKTEEENTNLYFNSAYKEARRNHRNDANSLANEVTILTVNYAQQIKDIDQRREAAIAYQQLLEKTKKTHQALANRFKGQMSPKEKVAFCQDYFPPTNNQSKQSQDDIQVPPPRQLPKQNEEDLKQMQKILKDYSQDIKPLIKTMDKKF